MKTTAARFIASATLLGGCAGTTSPVASQPPAADLEIALQYEPQMDPLTQDGRGRLMGSGVGRATGALSGDVRWTLFEVQNDTSCELQMVGTITDGNGAVVDFEAIGFGRRPSAASGVWDMTASSEFRDREGPGTPLAGRVGAWVGHFDASTGKHRYRVHLPAREQARDD